MYVSVVCVCVCECVCVENVSSYIVIIDILYCDHYCFVKLYKMVFRTCDDACQSRWPPQLGAVMTELRPAQKWKVFSILADF